MTSIEGAPASAGVGPTRPTEPQKDVRAGVLAAIGAYGIWGAFPLFFRLLDGVNPLIIVAHRMIWSLVFVGAVLAGGRRLDEVRAALANRRALAILFVSTTLLAVNWLIFIWAVENQRVLDISFGYFINPLVNVAIGMMLLGERQNRLQILAIAIATVAVVIQSFALGAPPWVALSLALTFGFYGYLRKTVAVGSAPGLFIETALMLPLALGYLGYTVVTMGAGPHADPLTFGLLMLTGPVTAVALLMFAFATRQLRLTTIGMFQYIAPTLHFLTAVVLFGEPLTANSLVSFALIWVSLAIFSYDSYARRGNGRM